MMEKLIFLVVILIGSCHGLYFHIGETERKCFIEEIPDETTGKQLKKFHNKTDLLTFAFRQQ